MIHMTFQNTNSKTYSGIEQYEDGNICQPSTSTSEQEILFGTPTRNKIVTVTQDHERYDHSYFCQPSTSTLEQEIRFGTPTRNKILTVTQDHERYDHSYFCQPSSSTSEQEMNFSIPTRNTVNVTQESKTKKSVLKELRVGRQSLLTPKARHLYGRVIDSSKKLARLSRKLFSYQEKLRAAKKLSDSPNFQNLIKHVNTFTYTFILSQIRSRLVARARRFTTEETILSLTLLKASGKGYRLLSKIFALPPKRTLTNLLQKIPIKPGINKRMFESFKNNVAKMKKIDRTCIVIFDEMSISSYLQYNQKDDSIEGLEDFGNERFPALADHVNVFMVKGVYRQCKQPICFTFSNGPTKSLRLKNLIKNIVSECQEVGLTVVATVCDQSGHNRSAINLLQKETREKFLKEGMEKTCFGYCINGKEVVPLYDVPHLFKGVRNNLLAKDLHYKINNKPGIAKWDHIEQFYFLDSSEPLKICPKLTDEHVLKDKIKKMKVKNCTQVFSYQVGSLMKKIVEWKAQVDLAPEAADTGEVILFYDELFDSLNFSQKTAPASKPLKGDLTKESGHEKFWKNALEILKSMKFFSKEKQKFVSTPSLTNLKYTLQGFLYLKDKLLYSKNHFLLLSFQQDALENFFGCLRSYGVREVSPSALHVTTSFKALLVNNFISSHSPGSNCEEDASEGALDNLRYFLTEPSESVESLENVQSSESEVDITLPASINLHRRSKIGRCTITYISGYIAKKIMKSITCSFCKNNLLFRDNNQDLDFVEGRQYQNSRLTKPGTFLTFLVSQSVNRLFYLILPRISNYKKISIILRKIILEQLTFNLVNCPDHSGNDLKLCNLIIRCCLYFWCRKFNAVTKGKDTKFLKFLNTQPNREFIDPIILTAHKKFLSKKKRALKNHK